MIPLSVARPSASGGGFSANAIYAPLTPDTSAPVVTIVEPLDCSTVELGGSLVASFNCVDPGDSDPSPACVGDVTNGTSVDTSTPGQHRFSVYAAGVSGLQNLGNGYYQFNWATPKSYANSCKTLHLALGDGADHTAQFKFTK